MTAETSRFAIRKRQTVMGSRHKWWIVLFTNEQGQQKRVAVYKRWDSALAHVETAVRRFGRGHL